MDVDLRKVRYFVVVAEELNFGRAAQRLHIAQPVLSRQIASLEHELGVTLFDRSHRGTELSAAGLALLDDARALLARAEVWRTRARGAASGTAHLTVGFMPGIIVTPVVAELRRRFEHLTVDVVRTGWDDQVEVVRHGTVDASFVRLPVDAEDLVVVPLFDEPRVVALPADHPLARAERVTLTDIAALDLLQPPDAHPEWRDAAAAARPPRARRRPPAVNTVEEKLEHVAGDRGIVLLPESAALFYSRPDIAYRHVDGLGPVASAVVHERDRTSPELTALVAIATEVFAGAGTGRVGATRT